MTAQIKNGVNDEAYWGLLPANGDSRRIPHLLRQLRGPDREHRTVAWAELRDLVNHQGSVSDATVKVLAPLLAQAAERTTPRLEVFDFITGLAEYASCPGKRGLALRKALAEGYPFFTDGLDGPAGAEREVAALILGNLPERRSDSIPELENLIARELEPAPLAVAIWALGTLQPAPREDTFLSLARTAKHPLARAVASAFVVRWRLGESDEREVRAVADAIFHKSDASVRLPYGFLEDSLQCPLGGTLLQQIRTKRYSPGLQQR